MSLILHVSHFANFTNPLIFIEFGADIVSIVCVLLFRIMMSERLSASMRHRDTARGAGFKSKFFARKRPSAAVSKRKSRLSVALKKSNSSVSPEEDIKPPEIVRKRAESGESGESGDSEPLLSPRSELRGIRESAEAAGAVLRKSPPVRFHRYASSGIGF